MRKSIALLICAGVAISSNNVEAITGFGRFRSSLFWGTAASLFAYRMQAKPLDKKKFPCPLIKKNTGENDEHYGLKDELRGRTYKSAGAGAAMALFVQWVTSYYTPSYRHSWALKERENLSRTVLFNHLVTASNMKEILIASGAESTPLQYVTLFLRLSEMDKKLSELKNELEIALKDTGESSVLGIQIANLIDQIDSDLIRIRESEHNVKNYDVAAWAKQWEIHTNTKLKEKEIAAMNQPHVNYHVAYHV